MEEGRQTPVPDDAGDKRGPSLVLISHSAKLAEGVRELVEQVAQGKVAVFAVGGFEGDSLGTDPAAIEAALEEAENPAGTLVLMDVGSSILGAEMALEGWPAERRARVLLSEAPLVEGAVAAAAQLAAGATLAEAAAEARGALRPKAQHLGVAPELPTLNNEIPPGHEQTVRVPNAMGLHARPVALFVRAAAEYGAEVWVRNLSRSTGPASARSANDLALLDARQGDEIAILAAGPDGDAAVAALTRLVASGFGEPAQTEAATQRGEAAPATAPGTWQGIPGSPGIAAGAALVLRPALPPVEERQVGAPAPEMARLTRAIADARSEIAALRRETAARVGEYDAAIFDAHLLFLDDPSLIGETEARIRDGRVNAEAAWKGAVDALAARYDDSGNTLLRTRAADVRDVGARVLGHLLGTRGTGGILLAHPAIVIASDLTPSQAATLDPRRALAICTAGGGPTAHAAILARRLGVPAVVGLGPGLLAIRDGTPLLVDGDNGWLLVDPGPEARASYERKARAWQARRRAANRARLLPAATRDGHVVEMLANAGGPRDAREALAQGAEGIGLLRTEFLYLDRRAAPTEDEQTEAYAAILATMGQRPVVIRTLDAGGDKPLPYLDLPGEANPFLGQRGLRLGLARPDLLAAQLRAILRAGAGYRMKIMFPMVATVPELVAAREALARARDDLLRAGREIADPVEVGVMVEVPSAALLAEALAPLVDFFSIGTNDLAQYTLAADRTSSLTAPLADALDPAVLRLIARVCESEHARGKRVAICGETAGEPLAIPILVGLGLDELSMNPAALAEAKAVVRRLDNDGARDLATAALAQESAGAVRALVRRRLPWLGSR